jgi:hypothetical protein
VSIQEPAAGVEFRPVRLVPFDVRLAKVRKTKSGLKIHTTLDLRGCLLACVLNTTAKTHDVRAAHVLSFDAGTIVVMNRGVNGYKLFALWTTQGLFFVTHLKEDTRYAVVEKRPVVTSTTILSDEINELDGAAAAEKCPHRLRRVRVWDAEYDRAFVFLSNIQHLTVTTIAQIYHERWQIELFFRALKQEPETAHLCRHLRQDGATPCSPTAQALQTPFRVPLEYLHPRSRLPRLAGLAEPARCPTR